MSLAPEERNVLSACDTLRSSGAAVFGPFGSINIWSLWDRKHADLLFGEPWKQDAKFLPDHKPASTDCFARIPDREARTE